MTPPPGSPPGWPGPCTERGVRAVEVRPSCEHAELPSYRRAGPGRWQCRATRGLTPLAGTLPSPAASESVFRYRGDHCRTLQVGHWRSPRMPLGCRGGAQARFRVVSASHTKSRRKFKSHRSDLRSQPRLLVYKTGVDISQQWTTPNGESLLPSRWNDLEMAKNKGLENDDSGGRCLGWRCLA